MMCLESIRENNREAAVEAAEMDRYPMVLDEYDLTDMRAGKMDGCLIPYIGDYEPPGWNRISLPGMVDDHGPGYDPSFFVDSSGFGQPGEPALTVREFAERCEPGFGYADRNTLSQPRGQKRRWAHTSRE